VHKKPTRSTRRAELLRRALSHIDSGSYTEYDGYLIFGTSDAFEMIDNIAKPDSESEDRYLLNAVHEFISDLRQHRGRAEATKRTTLDKPPELKTNALGHAILQAPGAKVNVDAEEALDAAFAAEVLGKLPRMVERAASLDEIGDNEIGRDLVPDHVKRYWKEAHRCYLYGFPVACAVLCRAILESALIEKIDPDRRIDRALRDEARKSGNPKESYVGRLVDEADKRHILTDDRPKCAIEVRDAGNDAIHNHGEFEKLQSDPHRGIAYIVESTRKILIDLYSGGS
jgi:hypothetical protein